MDQAHLLEHGTLARLSRAEQQHLDLIAKVLAVPLELVLDLLVAWERACDQPESTWLGLLHSRAFAPGSSMWDEAPQPMMID